MTGNPSSHVIPATDRQMTIMQKALWLSEQTPGVRNYNLEFIQVRVSGNLKIEALDKAFVELAARHESLRTSYYSSGEDVFSRITETSDTILEYHQLTQDISIEERLTLASSLLDDYRRTGVCLALRPYMKPLLIKVAENSYILLLCYHHLSVDGRSLGVLLEELGFLYRKNVGLENTDLPVPTQFQDFVVWQRQWLSSDEALQQKQNLLSGPQSLSEPFLLPSLKQDLEGDYTSHCLEQEVPNEICEALVSEAMAKGLSIFMFILSRYFLAVHAALPRQSITIETGVLNRPEDKFEKTIGWFSNVLPVTVEFNEKTRGKDVEQQVLDGVLTILENQNYPFAKLYKEKFSQHEQKPFPVWGNIFFNMFGMDDTLNFGPNIHCDFDYLKKITEATDLTCHVIWGDKNNPSLIRFYYPIRKFDRLMIKNVFDSFVSFLSTSINHEKHGATIARANSS